jgi:hypothetical protein
MYRLCDWLIKNNYWLKRIAQFGKRLALVEISKASTEIINMVFNSLHFSEVEST